MERALCYILWNPDLVAFRIGGFPFRWYSLCWLVGLVLAYLIERWLYREQGVSKEKFDPLFVYAFFGIIIGSRLGHCLFYEPGYFLSSGRHVVEMVLPIRFLPDGGWRFTGYEGLASHGGTLGLALALLLYVRKTGLGTWMVLDNAGICAPASACMIRIGNLMNSEIIGKPTDVPWAFVFERVDTLPRHPGQLYEAIAYAAFFVVGVWLYRRHPGKVGTGFFFGLCITLIFAFRFLVEYLKDVQEAFEEGMALDMGQLLSIPFIILGIACMARGRRKERPGAR